MSRDSLPGNLAFLCSYYPSIASVCRRIEINRQQFNKYLSGQTVPSRRNMRRICDFFGVSESELLLDHRRFVEIVGLKRRPVVGGGPTDMLTHIEELYRESGDMGRYVGYYFRYFYSFGHAGKIIKCLAAVYERDGRYYWRSIERLKLEGRYGVKTSKYAGALFLLGDRIFVLEYETLLKSSITQLILYPSYRTSPTFLVGVQTGMPLLRGRKPAASIVLLEYLGKSIDLRKALRTCGLFDDADPMLDPGIRSLINNRVRPDSFVLEADDA